MQALTVKIRILPENPTFLLQQAIEYIDTVNYLTIQAYILDKFPDLTTVDVSASLPPAVLNQVIRDSKSVFQKYLKTQNLSKLKPAELTDRDRQLLNGAKLGLLRVIEKKDKWFAQISIPKKPEAAAQSEKVLGVELGLKVLAVGL